MASMRAIVTGGAGFIGSHLVGRPGARDAEVLVVDNLATGRLDRARRDPVREARRPRRRRGSPRRSRGYGPTRRLPPRGAGRRPRLGARSRPSTRPSTSSARSTSLTAALAHDAQVVFASTGGAIYGEKARRPTPEDEPVEPEAPYGTAKHCAEEYLRLFNRLHGTRHVALRLGNVFGPRQDPAGEAGVVSIFSGRVVRDEPLTIFGDGTQTRDYVWVGDVVPAFLAAADAGRGAAGTSAPASRRACSTWSTRSRGPRGKRIEPQFAPARAGELQASALDASAHRARPRRVAADRPSPTACRASTRGSPPASPRAAPCVSA